MFSIVEVVSQGKKTQYPSVIRRFVLGRGSVNKNFASNKFSFVSLLVEKEDKRAVSEWVSPVVRFAPHVVHANPCGKMVYCWIFAAIKAEWLTWLIEKYWSYEKEVFKILENVFGKC